MDITEWAKTMETKKSKRRCSICDLGRDACDEIEKLLDMKEKGDITKVTQEQLRGFLREKYNFDGTRYTIRDHMRECLKRDWRTGGPL